MYTTVRSAMFVTDPPTLKEINMGIEKDYTKQELAEAIAKGLYTNTGFRFQSDAVQGEIESLVKHRKDNLVAIIEGSVLALDYLFGNTLYVEGANKNV